jgi:hypothetical protein
MSTDLQVKETLGEKFLIWSFRIYILLVVLVLLVAIVIGVIYFLLQLVDLCRSWM